MAKINRILFFKLDPNPAERMSCCVFIGVEKKHGKIRKFSSGFLDCFLSSNRGMGTVCEAVSHKM